MKTKKQLIYANECYLVMGIVFKVYKVHGFGHKEIIYQKALIKEFQESGIKFEEQLRCKVMYKGEVLGLYVFDFLVFDKIVLEIKQKSYISSRDIDQLFKYLKAKKLKLGIIITFTKDGVGYKRIVNLR